jgi:hypothetical protein
MNHKGEALQRPHNVTIGPLDAEETTQKKESGIHDPNHKAEMKKKKSRKSRNKGRGAN